MVLLGGALEAPAGRKLSSIEPLMQQEQDYLRMALARLLAVGPELVVVERSVARWVQEELLARGVTLVLNIKHDLMERLARCMGTRVVQSVEALTPAYIGTCKEFRVEGSAPVGPPLAATPTAPIPGFMSPGGPLAAAAAASVTGMNAPAGAAAAAGAASAPARSIMSFVCASPVGATILLRGASAEQLVRVKRVARFAVLAAYQGRLEACFLADQMAAAIAAAGDEREWPRLCVQGSSLLC